MDFFSSLGKSERRVIETVVRLGNFQPGVAGNPWGFKLVAGAMSARTFAAVTARVVPFRAVVTAALDVCSSSLSR